MKKSSDPLFEFLTIKGERRPKLSDEERDELVARLPRGTLTEEHIALLDADYLRAFLKSRKHPPTAGNESAGATVQAIRNFQVTGLIYAAKSKRARKIGGLKSGGVVESAQRPSPEQVERAIRMAIKGGHPMREIPRRVKESGINLSIRQIRNIGQQHGLLPRHGSKGKR